MRLCGGRVPGNACQETQAFARALHLAIELGGAALRLQPAPPHARRTHAKRRHAGAGGGAGGSNGAASTAVVLAGAAAAAEAAAEEATEAAAAEGAAASRAQLVLQLAVHARKLWHLLLDAALGPGVQWHSPARPAASAAPAAASSSSASAPAAAAASSAAATQAQVRITLPAGTVAGQTIRVQIPAAAGSGKPAQFVQAVRVRVRIT